MELHKEMSPKAQLMVTADTFSSLSVLWVGDGCSAGLDQIYMPGPSHSTVVWLLSRACYCQDKGWSVARLSETFRVVWSLPYNWYSIPPYSVFVSHMATCPSWHPWGSAVFSPCGVDKERVSVCQWGKVGQFLHQLSLRGNRGLLGEGATGPKEGVSGEAMRPGTPLSMFPSPLCFGEQIWDVSGGEQSSPESTLLVSSIDGPSLCIQDKLIHFQRRERQRASDLKFKILY